jgi:hypothetical protein
VNDADVVRRSRGEPEAFGILFDRHADAIFDFFSRRVPRAEVDMGTGTGGICLVGQGPSLPDGEDPVDVAVPAGLMSTYCPTG